MSDDATRSDEPEPAADPLAIFIAAHHEARRSNPGTKRFNGGEHAWLGGHGAALACQRLSAEPGMSVGPDLFQLIPRKDGREVLPYGELVALSGDLYRSPQELFEEEPSRLPWRNVRDVAAIRDVLYEELQWIEERAKQTRLTPYPENNLRMAWIAKSYVELALKNTDHFGWHNVLCYCLHHEQALRLAAEAGDDNEAFRRAQYTNAFADHFLTDGFAAGHIRVPRAEIRAWAAEQGLNEKIAGSLSKLLHDQDGHIDVSSLHGVVNDNDRPETDGLFVENAAGVTWYTRCDGQLFTGQQPMTSAPITQAVEAVAASVTELLLAWRRRELPAGTYAATNFVPFPHRTTVPLIQKFPADLPDARLDALWSSIGWYAKIPWIARLERKHVRDLFVALPEIMTRFRANIVSDIRKDARRLRIAPAYLAAFREIA